MSRSASRAVQRGQCVTKCCGQKGQCDVHVTVMMLMCHCSIQRGDMSLCQCQQYEYVTMSQSIIFGQLESLYFYSQTGLKIKKEMFLLALLLDHNLLVLLSSSLPHFTHSLTQPCLHTPSSIPWREEAEGARVRRENCGGGGRSMPGLQTQLLPLIFSWLEPVSDTSCQTPTSRPFHSVTAVNSHFPFSHSV